ncbi:unnamed protein product [Phytophthora lilii]|uniref:Unnamed protein product n=1 Tax=Phytophthora lilii TaxID=2077276 RepID=A0A9W6TC34_9STRA|nr:unnamed protein product [Phytophthora lilii]
MPTQRSYAIQKKGDAILLSESVGERAAAMQLDIPRRTLRDWIEGKERIEDFDGPQTSKTLTGQGAKGIIPFAHDLVTFMKDVRREKEVSLQFNTVCYVRQIRNWGPISAAVEQFNAHVSEAGVDVVSETTSALVCPLPANSTAVCQPLDVGVMGPLTKKITACCNWKVRILNTVKLDEAEGRQHSGRDRSGCWKPLEGKNEDSKVID